MSAQSDSGVSRLQVRTGLLAGLLLMIVALRLVPYVMHLFGMSINPGSTIYPWNLSPLGALCLFGGARFADRRWAYVIPLSAILVSNIGIWALTGRLDWAFDPQVFAMMGAFALTISIGTWLRNRRSILAVAGTGLVAELVFFIVTNFAVWAFGDGTLYPHTMTGLIACYVAAIPFFRNSLISMGLFGAVLFSPMAVVKRDSPILEISPALAAR